MLQQAPPERLEALARDADFCAHYDEVMEWLAVERSAPAGWFLEQYPGLDSARPVAYFCAEFGLHASVPIYSGGLGVLAGDHCKTASDLAIPLVGIGLFYTKGYFDQRIRPDGWQEDSDDAVNPDTTPLVPVTARTGRRGSRCSRPSAGRSTSAPGRCSAGRTVLYLLDTDLEANHPDDRELTVEALRRRPADAPPPGVDPRRRRRARAARPRHHARARGTPTKATRPS